MQRLRLSAALVATAPLRAALATPRPALLHLRRSRRTATVRLMSTDANGNSSASSSAVAVVSTPQTAAAAEEAAHSWSTPGDDAGAAFDDSAPSEPSAPVVYEPFPASIEWQIVRDNHLLPPGLQIEMDLESGVKRARIPPPPAPPAAAAQQPQPEQSQQQAEGQAPAANDSTSAPAPAAASSSSAAPPASASSKTTLNGKSKGPGASQPKRGFVTSRKVHTLGPRPVIYPVFPPPTPSFLASRALMPVAPTPIISVAPMVDVTDRHFRYLLRLISKHTVLYTPMIVSNACVRAPHAYPLYVEHEAVEHPLVAQLGGCEPESMVKAALILQSQGFQQININIGCPAPSASGHHYGCILMGDPAFPETVKALTSALSIPVTIKCRIGLNKEDSFEYFVDFVERCWRIGGVTRFIVHARKAILNLRTHKNRSVPPLRYDFVHRLKELYPQLHIEINGGFDSWDAVEAQVREHGLQGVMLGRLAWKQPYAFAEVDRRFYGSSETPPTRKEVMERYIQYAERIWAAHLETMSAWEARVAEWEAAGRPEQPTGESIGERHGSVHPASPLHPPYQVELRTLLKPASYLYANEPGYKRFRALYEEAVLQPGATPRLVLERAMKAVEPPPMREWGSKDPGFEHCARAKEEMAAAAARGQVVPDEGQQECKIDDSCSSSSSFIDATAAALEAASISAVQEKAVAQQAM